MDWLVEEYNVIDLKRWRERQFFHYRLLALCIISGCYMLTFMPAMVYLSHIQQQKKTLYAKLQVISGHEQVINKMTPEGLLAINQLVFAKRHYVLALVDRLARIPRDVVLVRLECRKQICEEDVSSDRLQSLMRVATQNEVKDLKQGGCPLCYHAKINVMLS